MAFLGRPSRGLPTVLRAGPRVGAGCTIHTSCQPAGVCVTHWESLSASLRPLLLPAVHGPARSQGDLVNRPLTAQCPRGLRHCALQVPSTVLGTRQVLGAVESASEGLDTERNEPLRSPTLSSAITSHQLTRRVFCLPRRLQLVFLKTQHVGTLVADNEHMWRLTCSRGLSGTSISDMCVQVGVREAVRCPRELVDFLILATSSCVRSFSETQSSMARIYPALTVGLARSRALPRTGLCGSLSSVKGRARHPQMRRPRLRALRSPAVASGGRAGTGPL